MSGPCRAMNITTSLLKPYPLLAIGLLSRMYSRSLKKDGNTTSIKEMNSTHKITGKRMGLAFIASQLCLRCITIKIQFSSSKKPVQRRQWHPTPVLLPRKSHGWRSLVGCSPWGRWESDTTEQLHFHFSPSCIGEGNGNPLQGSCLENPRDGGAWWAAVYGVAQSQIQSDLAAAAAAACSI